MRTLLVNQQAMRDSHLKMIALFIESQAPEVPLREVRKNYFEGEEAFTVDYEQMQFDCVRRQAIEDTSNYDYYNGTGTSYNEIYDEITVLGAYRQDSDENNEELVEELNLKLC